MNFTREPIIETIITPKDGFRLVIRNSNGNSQEEYSVSSVEVVSFGKSFFFRSLEKPKSFLLPVSDYEVLEARETRTVLKKPHIEKSIKIAGGKAAGKGRGKEHPPEEDEGPPDSSKKRGRGKTSRRRRPPKKDEGAQTTKEEAPALVQQPTTAEEAGAPTEAPVRRTLLPPPTSLISEQISRYKDYLAAEGALLPEELEEGKKIEELPKEPTEDLSFFPEEGSESQPPPIFEGEPQEESKVVEIKEEEKAPTSPESEDR